MKKINISSVFISIFLLLATYAQSQEIKKKNCIFANYVEI